MKKKITKEEIDTFVKILKDFNLIMKKLKLSIYFLNIYEYHSTQHLKLFLDKFTIGWQSIIDLLVKLEKDKHYNYPIGVIVRSIVVDCITLEYLMFEMKIVDGIRDEKRFMREVKKLDYKFNKAKFEYIKKFFEKETVECQREMKEQHEFNLRVLNYDFFQINNKGLYELKTYNINGVEISNMINSTFKPKHIFQIFKLLSQFEHYSIYSSELLNDNKRGNFKLFLQSFHHTLIVIGKVLDYSSLNESRIREIFKNLGVEFSDYVVDFNKNGK